MNYEEGSEYQYLVDGESEKVLSEVPGGYTGLARRDLAIESIYEYGSRVGFWRLMRLFADYQAPITVTGCAQASELNPAAARAIVEAGYDICCHGWRWVYHSELSEAEEREHIRRAVESIRNLTGERPLGWYCRYAPSENTRRLVVEDGGFLYDLDAYNDDLPYWVDGKSHLVILVQSRSQRRQICDCPRLWSGRGLRQDFIESFDVLYEEAPRRRK